MPEGNQATRRQYGTPESFLQARQTQITLLGYGATSGEVLDHLCQLNTTLHALDHPGLNVTTYDSGIVYRRVFTPIHTIYRCGEPKDSTIQVTPSTG